MKEPIKGMGRTRLGRFAAVTVPASALAAGLGAAMLSGMVGAVLSSADGFTLESNEITTDGLKARAGAAEVANGDTATVYAETGPNTMANQIRVSTPAVTIPVLGFGAYLTIDSSDPAIELGAVGLNASTLDTPSGASLGSTTIGVAQSAAGFNETSPGSGYVADAFALTSDSASLPDVTAQAYAVTLTSLNLSNLSLAVNIAN